MKKLFYFAMALGLVACQAEKVDVNGAVETEANYLTVNIKAANGFTRAYDDIKDGYEDGTSFNESDVKQIRFYFFDKNGAAVPVTVTGASYSDFNVNADGFDDVEIGDKEENGLPESIEHKLQATVILHKTIENGVKSGLPAQLVAVLNPNTAELSKLGNPSLTKLTDAVVNGLAINTTADGKSKTFVMTNSVYADEKNGETISFNAVEISDDNLASTPEAATKNPVTVYVERVVAKLSVEIGLTTVDDLENVFDTGVTYGLGANEKKVYVQLLGWNVTATADQSFLVKNINPAWAGAVGTVEEITDDSGLFQTADEPWNYAGFHRSYWAYNPAVVNLQYGTYDGEEHFPSDEDNVNPALTHKFSTEVAYLPENAGQSSGEAANADPSQVILAAQLVDDEGNPLPLAEFMGLKFVYGNDNADTFKEVKDAILAAFPYVYYRYKEDEDRYVQLSPADIDIKTAWEVAGDDMPESGRYLVYAQLSAEETWYIIEEGDLSADGKLAEGKSVKEVNDDINEQLKKTGAAKIWNEGKTYYYFNIRHLADPTFKDTGDALETAKKNAPGYYGVVRNHVYKTKITGLTGLGTPVFNPNEIIIPEKPNEEEVFLAAEINILAWRIVNQSVDLVW